jgi:cytochrome c
MGRRDMFDTMTMVKAVGGFCGALLVFLFANWAAQTLYFGGEGHEEHAQSYTIAVADAAPAETEEAVAEPTYTEVAATADAAAGEGLFKACKACHKIDGTNATGPHLNGVVGRNHGAVEGFAYSEAMLALSAEVWTPEALFTFLQNPKAAMPGTKMGYAGMKKPQDRANLIAYLETLK